jgi:hypothetical protein
MSLDGYVKNISNRWVHAMKRSIGPGSEIPLSELYEQYGVKHGIQAGEDFIKWLRNVKLKDKNKWQIIYSAADKEVEVPKSDSVEVKETNKRTVNRVAPMVATKMDVADIVGLSVRKGREIIPKVMDLNLLKYALQEANQLSGKDSLCRIIRKRIRDLQIAR